jgi:hypothetical protein
VEVFAGFTVSPKSIDVHNSKATISFIRDSDFDGLPSIVN